MFIMPLGLIKMNKKEGRGEKIETNKGDMIGWIPGLIPGMLDIGSWECV